METNKDLKVVSTLWGEETISLRDDKIAGQVAKEEGDKFEDYVEELLIEIGFLALLELVFTLKDRICTIF